MSGEGLLAGVRVLDLSLLGPAAPALLLLALSSSAAFPCSLCEAGYESCGVCLNRVERAECPTSDALDIMPNCTGVRLGEMCEADGECGTSTVLNNCENMNWDGASCSGLWLGLGSGFIVRLPAARQGTLPPGAKALSKTGQRRGSGWGQGSGRRQQQRKRQR